MANDQLTLGQFFAAEEETWQKRLSKVSSGEALTDVKDKIFEQTKVKWPMVLGPIAEKMVDLLDIPIPTIMVASWKKYKVLLEYLDRVKYPPGEVFLVPMAEHTILSEHHPFIEIKVDERPVGRIEFEITLSLNVEGILLKVQDGKIMEVVTGNCTGAGKISCENQVLVEKETGSITLPGSIKLGEGVPILPV